MLIQQKYRYMAFSHLFLHSIQSNTSYYHWLSHLINWKLERICWFILLFYYSRVTLYSLNWSVNNDGYCLLDNFSTSICMLPVHRITNIRNLFAFMSGWCQVYPITGLHMVFDKSVNMKFPIIKKQVNIFCWVNTKLYTTKSGFTNYYLQYYKLTTWTLCIYTDRLDFTDITHS